MSAKRESSMEPKSQPQRWPTDVTNPQPSQQPGEKRPETDAPTAASTGTPMGYCDNDHRYPSPTMEGQGPQWPHVKVSNCVNWRPAPAPSEPGGSAEQFKEWAYKFVAESINTTTTLVQDLLAIRVAELVRAQLQERERERDSWQSSFEAMNHHFLRVEKDRDTAEAKLAASEATIQRLREALHLASRHLGNFANEEFWSDKVGCLQWMGKRHAIDFAKEAQGQAETALKNDSK